MMDGFYVVYKLMKDHNVYHLLNYYKTIEQAELHAENIGEDVKILKLIEIPHNIPVDEFNKIWIEQQSAER